jgi:hypothetical protein
MCVCVCRQGICVDLLQSSKKWSKTIDAICLFHFLRPICPVCPRYIPSINVASGISVTSSDHFNIISSDGSAHCLFASFLVCLTTCFCARASEYERPVLDDCSVHDWSWFLALSSSFVHQQRPALAQLTYWPGRPPQVVSNSLHRWKQTELRLGVAQTSLACRCETFPL